MNQSGTIFGVRTWAQKLLSFARLLILDRRLVLARRLILVTVLAFGFIRLLRFSAFFFKVFQKLV